MSWSQARDGCQDWPPGQNIPTNVPHLPPREPTLREIRDPWDLNLCSHAFGPAVWWLLWRWEGGWKIEMIRKKNIGIFYLLVTKENHYFQFSTVNLEKCTEKFISALFLNLNLLEFSCTLMDPNTPRIKRAWDMRNPNLVISLNCQHIFNFT